MSVLIETSLGDLVVDLEVDKCPKTCENFLKLCGMKYYALNAFFNVSKDFIAQTGDPSATGTGGQSFSSLHYNSLPSSSRPSSPPPRYFKPEILNSLKHVTKGTVSMAIAPGVASSNDSEGGVEGGCGSQFFITLADNIEYLDGKHAVFGRVVEGEDVLDQINDSFVDSEGRPLKDIRIRHIEVLEDPFPDPTNFDPPPSPLLPPDDPSIRPRISDDELLDDPLTSGLTTEQKEAEQRTRDAEASALTLEMIGDLPFANVRPPENILFVAKLNPVTTDEDLELIFSRFGKILSCEVIRDKKTGDSLQYAFIEFDERESAEMAYFKMSNVLIDDRRIFVDFSQSVSKMNGLQIKNHINTSSRGGRGGSRGGGMSGRGSCDNHRGGGGGRGGISHAGTRRDDGYGMVFDKPSAGRHGHEDRRGGSGGGERRNDRDREPQRDRDRDRDRDRGQERDRRDRDRSSDRPRSNRDDVKLSDRERYRERDGQKDRHRESDRHRYDEKDRQRDRDRERNTGGDRERERRRDDERKDRSRSPSSSSRRYHR